MSIIDFDGPLGFNFSNCVIEKKLTGEHSQLNNQNQATQTFSNNYLYNFQAKSRENSHIKTVRDNIRSYTDCNRKSPRSNRYPQSM